MNQVERRKQPRKSHQIRAVAILDGDTPTAIDCVIFDASPAGAKLRLSSNIEVPDWFSLRIPVLNTSRNVGVRWRGDGELGVEFEEPCNELAALIAEPDAVRRRIEILRRLAIEEERFAVSQRAATVRSACIDRGGANPTARRQDSKTRETWPRRIAIF